MRSGGTTWDKDFDCKCFPYAICHKKTCCNFVWFLASISIMLGEQTEGRERKKERKREGNELFSRAGYAAG